MWKMEAGNTVGRMLAIVSSFVLIFAGRFVSAEPFAYTIAFPSVVVIDLATKTVVGRPQIPSTGPADTVNMPFDLALTPDGKSAYVTTDHHDICYPDGFCARAAVHKMDLATRSFGPPIRLRNSQDSIGHIAMSPDGRFAYVAERGNCYGARVIYVLDTQTDTLVGESMVIPFARRCNGGRHIVSADGKTLYIPTQDGIYLADIATRTVTLSAVQTPTYQGQLSADGKILYVAGYPGLGNIMAVDTATRQILWQVTAMPSEALALSPDNRTIVVAGWFFTIEPPRYQMIDTVSRALSGNAVLSPLPTPAPAYGAFFDGAYAPDGKHAYFTLVDTLDPSSSKLLLIEFDVLARTVSSVTTVAQLVNADSVPLRIQGNAAPQGGFPRTAVLDNFNRPDGFIGSSWTGANGVTEYRILGQVVDVGLAGRLYWQPQSYGPRQEAFVRFTGVDPDSITQGLQLKVQGTTLTRYTPSEGVIEVLYNAAAGTVRVQTWLPKATVATVYPPISRRYVNGDQFGARVDEAGVVTVYRNGVGIGSITLNSADRTYFNSRGGRIGLRYNSDASSAFLDDFGGGTVP